MPVTVAPLPVGREMESEAAPLPSALHLLHCLMQVPSFPAAPSPEERCWVFFHSLALQLALCFLLLIPHILRKRNCALQVKGGDAGGKPTGQ